MDIKEVFKDSQVCTKCKKEKPIDQFYTNGWLPVTKTGIKRRKYKPYCKPCELTHQRQTFLAKLERIVLELWGEYKCCMCGFDNKAALQFHHLDPSEKDRTIASMTTFSEAAIIEELEKCVILCANCHCIEHYGEHY